jgi:hypothetical protein
MNTVLRASLAVLICLTWCDVAQAGYIGYTFTSTITVSKTSESASGDSPASPFEDAYWFPSLTSGQTYAATGRVEYWPDLLAGSSPFPSSSVPMVFLSLGEYTFSIRPSLGFGVVNDDPTLGGADGVVFVDSFPHVDAGYMPASPWHGEDALVHLFDRSGTAFSNTSIPPSLDGLSFGDLLLFGAGTAADPQGVMHSTRLLLNGTIDDLKSIRGTVLRCRA